MAKVGVTIVADAEQQRKEIDLSMKQLQEWGRNINVFNATAVKAFRESAQAEKELNAEIGATAEQQAKLNGIIRQFEGQVESAANQTGHATERMSRGFAQVIASGNGAVRSIDSIIAAGGDLAFTFGPEGAALASILMITSAIAMHFTDSEAKIEETVQKFDKGLQDMLMNGTAIEAARAAAKAYVEELEAAGRAKAAADEKARAAQGLTTGPFGLNPVALFNYGSAFFRGKSAESQEDAARAANSAATIAEMHLGMVEVHEKELDALEKQRHQVNQDIAQAQTKLAGMTRSGHEHEYAAVQQQLAAARKELDATENRTRELEADRAKRIAEERKLLTNPADRAAFDAGVERLPSANIGAEHGDRENDVARGSRGAAERRGAARDAAAKAAQAANEAARAREAAAQAMLKQFQDDAFEQRLRAQGRDDEADFARIDREFDRRKDEIAKLKISEETKTQLLIALDEDRAAQRLALDDKIWDRINKQRNEQAAKDRARDKKVADEEARALQAKERLIEGIVRSSVNGIVEGHKSLGREVLKAALEPEIKHLEALAAKHFTIAAADAAVQNWKGAAEHGIAGALYTAGAAELGNLAGGGGGGGSKGGGGGGGGSGSGRELGTQGGAGEQMIKIEIVNVTKDLNGREISRVNQGIQRLNDLNSPIRVTL